MNETSVYLVRHGESKGNKENRMRGRADFKLTENGIIQAEKLAEVAATWDIKNIYTSPLKRAKSTAEIIGERCDVDVSVELGFQNISLGEWEGQTKEWVKNNYPEEWEVWRKNPEQLKMENFESLDEIQERAYRKLLELIKNNSGDSLCIVTHRAVIKPLIARILRMKSPYYWRIKMETASYSRVIYDGEVFYMDLFNQTMHLKERSK